MNSAFIFSFLPHAICEIAAAFAFVFWISEIWNRVPAPALVKLARHPAHVWIACGIVVAPAAVATALSMLITSAARPEVAMRFFSPLFYLLSFFYGVLFGLAASCCVGANERFPQRTAFAVAAILALTPPWHLAPYWLYLSIHTFCLLFVIVIASLILSDKKQAPPAVGSTSTPPPVPHKSSPLVALLVGFLPAIFVLITITFAVTGVSDHLSESASHGLLWLASAASVGCCIVSSFMLFRRKTGAAIAGAILLLFLNAFLAFFFGCCASITPGDFR